MDMQPAANYGLVIRRIRGLLQGSRKQVEVGEFKEGRVELEVKVTQGFLDNAMQVGWGSFTAA
ncbi:unnamed protein product [Fusarium graminearum]|uniref:Chromosome 3, complete genome n=1 Tax=Gibberella zeae (strain ATCC MYA-4620 / CBS 123657 / FGSC 9075 / NRRL 31084 / PH-1) TaxID=229533 RepID=A0A098DZ70_GIBZE|nr:unnamed protein product [Fusarium graminearum]CZS83775.1 unnamed protein product [Fusarium graminearum]